MKTPTQAILGYSRVIQGRKCYKQSINSTRLQGVDAKLNQPGYWMLSLNCVFQPSRKINYATLDDGFCFIRDIVLF